MPPLQQETAIFWVAWVFLPRDCHAVDFLPSYFSCLFSRGSSCVSLFWAYLGTLSRFLLRGDNVSGLMLYLTTRFTPKSMHGPERELADA